MLLFAYCNKLSNSPQVMLLEDAWTAFDISYLTHLYEKGKNAFILGMWANKKQ